jgi:N,N'-diacetyllegionaminate synthase
MKKEKVIIIAEAGVNHNGSYEVAEKLVIAAANAGADYVKFQTFRAENIVSKNASKAEYQKNNYKDGSNTQFDMLKKLEMPEEWHYKLIEIAKNVGIKFLSTGFDEQSIDFLDKINLDLFKIPSGEITNKLYLEHVASKKKRVIISTGMSNSKEVKNAILVLLNNGIKLEDISILHCNTEYPTPMSDVNLHAMSLIKKKFGVEVGYSDHTLGIEVPIAAVALGATIIEKHFTLDREMEGPDHLASLTPDELTKMVQSIRNVEMALSGNGKKEPSKSEMKNIDIVRKSLHYSCSLSAGTIISREHLISLRPGNGISPMKYESLIGLKLKNDVTKDEQIKLIDLE